MKGTLLLGIIVGLAAVSSKGQEGCDGPVVQPGYTYGTCACTNSATADQAHPVGGCSLGLTDHVDDYVSCGGSGFTYCNSQLKQVGSIGMRCKGTIRPGAQDQAEQAYRDCLRDCHNNNPIYTPCYLCWTNLLFCNYTVCAPDPTAALPIFRDVLSELGDYSGCVPPALAFSGARRSPDQVKQNYVGSKKAH